VALPFRLRHIRDGFWATCQLPSLNKDHADS
jgi:hypothetical protein